MEWLIDLFTRQTFLQAVAVITLICAVGIIFGNLKYKGVSLGVTFIFFAGIVVGHIGLEIDPKMLAFAQNFGLILFVYSLGVQVGPGFFTSLKKGGVKLNLLSIGVIFLGTLMAMIISWTTDISLPESMGLLSGAVTNTPMLGAAQQAVLQINPDAADVANAMAMACAVGYPFGVIGVIFSIIIIKMIFAKANKTSNIDESSENTFISEYHVTNPAIFGKSIKEITSSTDKKFIISRIWSQDIVHIPVGNTILQEGNRLLVISKKSDVHAITILFGEKASMDWNKKGIDWNAIDPNLVSRYVYITKDSLNGIKLGSLKLRNLYDINITRINRAGIDLLASPQLRLQIGDRLTIVGANIDIDEVAHKLGNEQKKLNNPYLFSIFTGILLGVILGAIPISLPGMSVPIKLGIAGGPIVVGILMGAFGPRLHVSTYSTRSANLMLRQFGIEIYLACLGLSAGQGFFETVFCSQGLIWIGVSILLAVVPVMIIGYIASKWCGVSYAENIGMLCGSMANPMALTYANSTVNGDEPSVSYATVYPLGIFLRVLTAQIIILVCL